MNGQLEKEPSSGLDSRPDGSSLDRRLEELKREEIEQACKQGRLSDLVRLATSTGGLLDDHLRQSAWPLLLGRSPCEVSPRQPELATVHPDEEQVQKDVDRAFVYYPTRESDQVIEARKKALYDLISQILRKHPKLRYIQGYHDIVQVIMLVLGREAAFAVVESISLLRIRDYMLPSLTPALRHLQLLPAILQLADRELAGHLVLPNPDYALPAALTLYAHQIEKYSDIARLFDFLLAHEPVISLYLFAAIIISRRESLLEIPAEDHDILFVTLQKLPQQLDLEPLIDDTVRLFQQHPPERLPNRAWHRLSSSCVLKTSRSIENPESLETAEKHLLKQIEEVKWEERRRKALSNAFRYRRRLAVTALTVAVGAVSVWLRRSGNDRAILSFIFSLMRGTRER